MNSKNLDTCNYEYSKGNLLEKPQTYQKTPFLGTKFLNSYKQNRLDILDKIKIEDSFSYDDFKTLENIYEINSTFELEYYLEYLLKNLPVNSKDVDIILKKFEVKKKLFTKYDSNFKELSNDFGLIKNYLLLSILCILLYEQNHSLRYLNGCLKINDTLISQFETLTHSDKKLLRFSIQNELDFIKQLCIKKEIDL